MERKDLSSDDLCAVRQTLDQAAIRDVIGLYFYGLDRRDFTVFTDCFTPDAYGEYDGGKAVHRGREAIITALRGISQFKSSSHLASSMMIKVDGDRAKADTYAVAFLLTDNEEGKGRILVRGLQYLDDFVHRPEGWRIAHRVHIPVWQYEATSVPPSLPQAT